MIPPKTKDLQGRKLSNRKRALRSARSTQGSEIEESRRIHKNEMRVRKERTCDWSSGEDRGHRLRANERCVIANAR